MLKSEDVVTLMLFNFNDLTISCPRELQCIELLDQMPLSPFDDHVIDYLNELSKRIIKDPRSRQYPDVATFAFFIRKANLLQIKREYTSEQIRTGRGVIFHVSPSNVPVNFAYSFISGLLAGNSNIVRIPSKEFDQINIVLDSIQKMHLEEQYHVISSRSIFVRYERTSKLTHDFSAICDVRVIWGGDETISDIRKNSIPAKSFDITFADRYSLCAINADELVKNQFIDKVVEGFYNDTYLFDQNACTSPHLIIWTGTEENVEKAQKLFWSRLHQIVKQKYLMSPVVAVDKLATFLSHSIRTNDLHKIASLDNLIWRTRLTTLEKNIYEHRCTSGYFYEYHADQLGEISKIVNRKYQTLAYFGYSREYLNNFARSYKMTGIDRIVPIGHTMDFSFHWDGYNLINTFSRLIDLY
jgi:hypothetical protein